MIEVVYFADPLALASTYVAFYAVVNTFEKYYILGAPCAHADPEGRANQSSFYPLVGLEALDPVAEESEPEVVLILSLPPSYHFSLFAPSEYM